MCRGECVGATGDFGWEERILRDVKWSSDLWTAHTLSSAGGFVILMLLYCTQINYWKDGQSSVRVCVEIIG
jgi:hypothetical protein